MTVDIPAVPLPAQSPPYGHGGIAHAIIVDIPAVPLPNESMKPLSIASQSMRRSGIRVILDMALRIPDAIHLEIGQPDFPTPAHIVEAAHAAMRQGFTKYTANAGLLSLREAIAAKARRDNGIQASADDVVVTTGGMGGLFSAAAAVLDPGDEVLAPDPGYPNYEMMATLCHARTVRYPLTGMADGFQPDFDALPALVTPRTKAIIVNSPGNPTGSVISADALAAIVAFAQRHDLYVISDECYEKIIFGAPHISPASMDADGRVITISSFSKTYSMTGWRIGYAIARPPVPATVSKLQEATVACASSVSQKAAEAALAGPQECVTDMARAYQRRRDLALDILRAHGLPTYAPQGAFYLLIDIDGCGLDSEQFARALLSEKKVAVAPGSTFGTRGDRYIRISTATADDVLREGLERVCEFIEERSSTSTQT
jgi:aspartate aminotransferase/aminotransferase